MALQPTLDNLFLLEDAFVFNSQTEDNSSVHDWMSIVK